MVFKEILMPVDKSQKHHQVVKELFGLKKAEGVLHMKHLMRILLLCQRNLHLRQEYL